jgi:hypothetical protein
MSSDLIKHVVAGVFFVTVTFLTALELRRPRERRLVRWGRSGAKISAFSVVVLSTWSASAASIALAPCFAMHVSQELEFEVMFGGICAMIVCGVCDHLTGSRRKEPIQPPETTRGK